MRLIDADELLHDIYECDEPMSHKYVSQIISEALTTRCKICAHWMRDAELDIWPDRRRCARSIQWTWPDFGCSLFERRDDDPD